MTNYIYQAIDPADCIDERTRNWDCGVIRVIRLWCLIVFIVWAWHIIVDVTLRVSVNTVGRFRSNTASQDFCTLTVREFSRTIILLRYFNMGCFGRIAIASVLGRFNIAATWLVSGNSTGGRCNVCITRNLSFYTSTSATDLQKFKWNILFNSLTNQDMETWPTPHEKCPANEV